MCLPIFLLEDHKYIIDIYSKALRCISFDVEMIVSYSLQQASKELTDSRLKGMQLAILDYSTPHYESSNFRSGEDIAKIIRTKFPEAKIIYMAGKFEWIELKNLIINIAPEGIIQKTDIDFKELCRIFKKVIEGEVFYSSGINKIICENQTRCIFLDSMNVKIIELLSKGIATKNLPNYLPLSLSGVHKRKAKIKAALNIDSGSDEAILKEARKKGFI